MSVIYIKTSWADNQAPSLSAGNLNKMEDGIGDCADEVNTHVADSDLHVTSAIKADVTANTAARHSSHSYRTNEEIQDIVGTLITAGVNVTTDYDDVSGILTINSTDTDTNTQLSAEQVQDIVGAFLVDGVNTSVVYDDAGNTISIDAVDTNTDTQLTNEQVHDIVGSLVSGSGNTSVVYNGAAGTLVITTDVDGAISTHAADVDAHHNNTNDPSADQKAAMDGAAYPNGANAFATMADVGGSGDATSIQGTNVDAGVGTPSDGDILVYRATGSDFVLESKPESGSNPALNDVSDVNLTSISDNDILAYDTTSGDWLNQTASEAGFSGVATSGSYNDLSDKPTIPDGIDYLDKATYMNPAEPLQVLSALTADSVPWTGVDGNPITDSGSGIVISNAERTKLGTIEDGADVTDTANVNAAGAVMNADASTASMLFVIDEDTMVSNEATKVPTQQSVKAYVDANGGISNVVEDTTPQLGGNLDSINNSIVDAKTVTFNSEYNVGDVSVSQSIDWNNGQKQKIILDATGQTLAFTDLANGIGNLVLKIVQDATGGRTLSFPIGVLWEGGTAPTLSTAANAIDIITFYFDGQYYYGTAGIGFS